MQAVVLAFWSKVGYAWVNLEKTSVITRTFSRPSPAFSRTVKSIAKIPWGCEAITLSGKVLTLGWLALATRQRVQMLQYSSISCHIGQKHLFLVVWSLQILSDHGVVEMFEHLTRKTLRKQELKNLFACSCLSETAIQNSISHTNLVPLLDKFADTFGPSCQFLF